MKTCRKTLSLVMVFALVMSLFCASVSADFTDQSSITNDEAAVVLTALGVIDGFEDGSFKPDTVLTREQAAAIIARMLLGDSADSLTAGSAPFSDVPADRWSAGYIAYCVSKGIVDGFEDGTFRPTDNLTCYQFAKMLLVALGYDAGTEGLTGSSWAINSASYAINAGIFDDVSSYSGDCDRDTAALMALNTLKADMVYYPSGSIEIDTGDSSIIIAGSSATRVTNNGSSDGNIGADGYMQFAERYFTKLELNEAADGTYGRPATFTWELGGDVIYTGTDESNLVATYTGYVTKGTLYSAIGSSVYSDLKSGDSDLYVYVDGEPYDGTDAQIDTGDVADFIERSSSGYAYYGDGKYLTGSGVQTELYVTDENDVYLVVINTYLAIAQDDYDESDGTLDVVYYSYLNEPDTDHDITLEDEDFDISGYVEDDYLLLTFDDGVVETAESAGTVSGEITGYTSGTSITVDGTRYYFASNMDYTEFEYDDFTINSDITLVLDDYGYVIGHGDASTGSSNYLYVLEVAQSGSLSSSGYEAAVIFADGTYDEISLRYIDGDTPDSDSLKSYTGWYSYTVNSSERYSLTEASTSLVEEIGDTTSNTDVTIRNGNVRYLLDGSSVQTDYTATSSTVFVVYDTSDNDYDVYTGYNNVPNVSDSNGVTVSALTNSSGYSVAVMIFVGKNASVSGGGGTSGDFVLAYYGPSKSVDSYGNTYYSYYAFVNGEDTTVSSTERLTLGVLYTDISYDEYGYIDEADNLGTDNVLDNDEYVILTWGTNGKPAINYSSGVIAMGINGVLPLADSYDIYLVDTYHDDYDTVTASRFASKYSGKISNAVTVYGVYDDDGYIVSLYVVADKILDI